MVTERSGGEKKGWEERGVVGKKKGSMEAAAVPLEGRVRRGGGHGLSRRKSGAGSPTAL